MSYIDVKALTLELFQSSPHLSQSASCVSIRQKGSEKRCYLMSWERRHLTLRDDNQLNEPVFRRESLSKATGDGYVRVLDRKTDVV